MKALRTPDARFENLPGYGFAPHYHDIPEPALEGSDALRLHYLDEGPQDGEIVLCMHGEPSWSYLYRTMIPVLVGAGHRVLAPDLIGFGKSDKPTRTSDYTYARHVEWMTHWLKALDLRGVTLVCQDWGGLIGLRMAAENEDRFARIVVANTGLPTGEQRVTDAFHRWREFSQKVPEFPVSTIIDGATTSELSPEILAAYDAPFPDESHKAGARVFPVLVPIDPNDPASAANKKAWEVFERWQKPVLTAFSDQDPITAGGFRPFQSRIPGAQGQPHTTVEGAGHFLQEDRGPELAAIVNAWLERPG